MSLTKKGIASRQLTGRGLGGSRSSSGIGLGSLGGSGSGRSGSWSGGSRGLLGLLVLGGLLDRLVAALLEGSLELALQVVEGAERCGEDESVSCSFLFLADRCATRLVDRSLLCGCPGCHRVWEIARPSLASNRLNRPDSSSDNHTEGDMQ
jgi:hypothetical protein